VASFTVVVGSYSQLKIVYINFPIHRKKFSIESYKIKILNKKAKVFENKGFFTVIIVLKCLKMPI
jgi:hypothetical protein